MIKKIIQEPFFHFAVLGCLVFLLNAFVSGTRSRASSTITVDNAVVMSLIAKFQAQNNIVPNKDQLDALIEQFINDEIMYREAVARGLDMDDEIVKRRLVQKFDFLQNDLSIIDEPDQRALKAYYHQRPELFTEAERVSFTHIYFRADHPEKDAGRLRAINLLRNNTADSLYGNRRRLGDRFALQQDYSDISRLEANQLFGKSELADTIFSAPEKTWVGPVDSGYGLHLVMVTNRKADFIPPFDLIAQQVRDAYMSEARREVNAANFQQIRSRYVIERDYLEK